MPNQAAKALSRDERHPDEAGVLQPERRLLRPLATIAGSPPSQPNTPAVITSGTTNCTTLTPRLPRPALSASALPFSALREEEARCWPSRRRSCRRRSRTAAPATRKTDIGVVGVLHGVADADGGNHQRPGRERGPQPAAEDRHHEGVEDAQHRAGNAGQRRQPEQLGRW